MPCPAILLTFDALHEAAVLLDASGNVLHGNRAAEQLFGWNVKPSAATTASASSTHVVSSMLSLAPVPADHMGRAATYPVPAASGTAGTEPTAGPTSAGSSTGLPRSSPPISGGQPNLTFNPKTQQASWADVLASLPDGKICKRDGVGYRLEPATTAGGSGDHGQPTRISFPASVNLLKMSDGAYAAPASRPDAEQAPELPDVDGGDSYVCVFVKELPHSADEWSRQHRAMSAMELRLKHSLTLSIVEAAFDAMFYINERGIIQMVNEAAVKQFGWSRSEFLGSNISLICGGGEFTLSRT